MKAAGKIVEPETQLVPYSLENAVVESLKTKYMDITIKPDDKAAYKMVKGGLKECQQIRLAVDEWYKDRKAWINKAGRHYDAERRRVHALIEPIETHLKTVREAEDNRKLKIEAERVLGIRTRILGLTVDPLTLPGKTTLELSSLFGKVFAVEITEDAFQEFAAEAQAVKEASFDTITKAIEVREKQDKEEAERKAESEHLEAQRKEQEAEAARLAAEKKAQDEAAAKVRAEQEAEAKRLEDLRKAEEEKVRKEREALEAEKRKLQEEKDRAEFEAKAKIRVTECARKEALALLDYVYPFDDLGTMPDTQWSKMYHEHKKAWDEQENAKFIAKLKEEQEARAKEQADREAKEAAEKARKEALKPDKEKLKIIAMNVDAFAFDEDVSLSSAEAKDIYSWFSYALSNLTKELIQKAVNL